jgi:hypothetical protein
MKLTILQVAERLQIPQEGVLVLIEQSTLTAEKINNDYMIEESALTSFETFGYETATLETIYQTPSEDDLSLITKKNIKL